MQAQPGLDAVLVLRLLQEHEGGSRILQQKNRVSFWDSRFFIFLQKNYFLNTFGISGADAARAIIKYQYHSRESKGGQSFAIIKIKPAVANFINEISGN